MNRVVRHLFLVTLALVAACTSTVLIDKSEPSVVYVGPDATTASADGAVDTAMVTPEPSADAGHDGGLTAWQRCVAATDGSVFVDADNLHVPECQQFLTDACSHRWEEPDGC